MLYPILRRERVPRLWEFDGLFDRWLGRAGELSPWVPEVDVRETGESILVQAELPGLARDNVDVRVENGVLTISGEKKQEVEEGKDDSAYHVFERRYGRFERSFTLPRGVNADAVTARFENGVLTVTLPKAENAKPRRVEIEAGNGSGKAAIGSK